VIKRTIRPATKHETAEHYLYLPEDRGRPVVVKTWRLFWLLTVKMTETVCD
jgi:hypothetical protein